MKDRTQNFKFDPIFAKINKFQICLKMFVNVYRFVFELLRAKQIAYTAHVRSRAYSHTHTHTDILGSYIFTYLLTKIRNSIFDPCQGFLFEKSKSRTNKDVTKLFVYNRDMLKISSSRPPSSESKIRTLSLDHHHLPKISDF